MFPMLKTVLGNLFKKSATVPYPMVKKPLSPIYRGEISINIDDCIFCGICQRRCPADAIKVVRADATWAIERFRCVQCQSCVDVCPKKCLNMVHELPSAETTKTRHEEKGKLPEPPKKPVIPAGEAKPTTPKVEGE